MKFTKKTKYILVLSSLFIIFSSIYIYNLKYKSSADYSNINYTYKIYDDESTFISNSNLIIRGNILDSKIQSINIAPDYTDPIIVKYKVLSIEVTDVIKGNVGVGDDVKIKYPVEDDERLFNTLDALLNTGSDCLLFLETYDDIASDVPSSLVSPYQSIIKFNDDKNLSESGYYDTSSNIFNNIPKEDLIDYLKNNIK